MPNREHFKKPNGQYNAAMLTWKYLNSNREILKKILSFAESNGISREIGPTRLVYHYLNNMTSIPACECGNELPFRTISIGYAQYCSRLCQGASKQVKSKRSASVKERYGVDHVFQHESVKAKSKDTILSNYGVDNVSKADAIKSKKVETCVSNRGTEYPMQSKVVLDKRYATCVERYGETSPWRSGEFRNSQYAKWIDTFGKVPSWSDSARAKRSRTRASKYEESLRLAGITIIGIDEDTVTAKCEKCGGTYEIQKYVMYQRHVRYGINPCTTCNPISGAVSAAETEIIEYVRSAYSGEVLGNHRIDGMELDIYLPELCLAIEYDGLYWHSDLYKGAGYHMGKTDKCREMGIRLMHVFEDEWIYKKEIVKSIIDGALGVKRRTVHARKCELFEMSDAEYDEFVRTNHIQGYATASARIGLRHDGETVSAMSFSKRRGISKRTGACEGEYEMIRYCSKIGVTVVGGASRMLAEFVRTRLPDLILTYSDRRYFQGDVYARLGFEFQYDTVPNYWYVFGNTRSHRFNHRKSVLVKNGADPAKTQAEIMSEKGIHLIYDCGNARYMLKINNKKRCDK